MFSLPSPKEANTICMLLNVYVCEIQDDRSLLSAASLSIMASVTGAGPAETRSYHLHPGFPHVPGPWATTCCLPRRIRWDLDGKWDGQNFSWCSLWPRALQAVFRPAVVPISLSHPLQGFASVESGAKGGTCRLTLPYGVMGTLIC